MVRNQFRLYNYEVFPSVVKAGEKTKVTVSSIGKKFSFDDEAYRVRFIPYEFSTVDHYKDDFKVNAARRAYEGYDEQIVKPVDGRLEVEYTFTREQEWTLSVNPVDDEKFVIDFPVFSAEEDLYERFPYIGDFHTHGADSPDAKTEAGNLAAEYRKAGYDFMALTDHERHYPSVNLVETYKDAPIDFTIFLGEEIHTKPSFYVHILNIGGTKSINDLVNDSPDYCIPEIEEYAKTLDIPEGLDAYDCAHRCWVSEKIRECGGMSVMAHPYWRLFNEYHMNNDVLKWLMENGKFDAMELTSGVSVEENNMQTAFYNEMRANGVDVPVIGVSDCHGPEKSMCFKWGKTMLFAKGDKLDLENAKEAVTNYYSVAIACEEWETPRIYGHYRMVRYARFLLKHFFPRHDELCVEEGLAMKNYFLGREGAKEELQRLKGRTRKYSEKFMRG